MLPILEVLSSAQFGDDIGCLGWSLYPEQPARLEEVSRIELEFPTDFLHRKEVRKFLHGRLIERMQAP